MRWVQHKHWIWVLATEIQTTAWITTRILPNDSNLWTISPARSKALVEGLCTGLWSCHVVVNTHSGTALALTDRTFPVQVTALSQSLFITGSIHEVAQISWRNLSSCVILVFRARRWARLGSSPGPTEASGSSVADFNVGVIGYK